MKNGVLPYLGFYPEYPPLAFLFIYFPYFITTDPAFYLFLYKSLAFIAMIAGTYFVYKWRNNAGDVWLYLFLLFVLQSSHYALVFHRFDIFVAVMTAAAIYYFFIKHKQKLGWVLLLLATFIKLYPLILFPVFYFKSKNKKAALWYIIPFIVINILLFVITNGRYISFLTQQGGRPVGYESILASFFMIPHLLFNTGIHPISYLNSLGLATDGFLVSVAKGLLWTFLLLPFFTKTQEIKKYHPLRLCLIVITCFILGNIAFSPQYLEWIIPFVVILALPEVILFATITGLTSWFFSFWGDPMNLWLILLISIRNILLLIFYYRLFSPKAVQKEFIESKKQE
jgi:hypothetical protein